MNIINAIKTVRLFQKKEPLIPLTTKWGENLDPHHVLEEYPRPQMKRNHFISLNGYWSYTINKNAAYPKTFEHHILVPFSPEAPLSGVQRQLLPDEYLWYQRDLPFKQHHKRCLLHFGAVDQIADIYINQQHICHHIGGYLPFSIDITEYLREDIDILAVRVQDVSDTSYHSKGKQRLKRGGMYYTAQSGIWQSVWMEWVSETYIKDVKMIPDSRAFVLSEYGGYACPIKEHMSLSKTYGYGIYENTKDFSNAFKKQMHSTVEPLIEQGLCASVYTQLSDIEEEVNGLLTYDRKVCKLNIK